MKTIKSVLLALVLCSAAFAQSNSSYFIAGQNCSATAATLAVTASGLVRAAAGNGSIQFWTVDNAGGTLTLNCPIDIPSRYGSSARITSIEVFYGAQTTAPTAVATAVISFVQMATSGGALAGTVSTAGGTKTVTPAVLQFAAGTTGTFYNQKITMGTPIAGLDARRVTYEQVFTFGANTGTLQLAGIQVNYTTTP